MGRWLLALTLSSTAGWCGMSYQQEIEQWRAAREARLKAVEGWLSLAGLIWLHEGANTIGSAAGNAILLPRGPARLGAIEYHGGQAALTIEPGVAVTVNNKPAANMPLAVEREGSNPDVVRFEDFAFFVIHRGERDAVRLKDKQSEARREFTGLHWYPVRAEYRVEAKWIPYQPPKMLSIPNILGETEQDQCPGAAEFTLDGQVFRLEPTVEGNELFFVFKDPTAGKTTYPAGRFLHTEMPSSGKVVLDFNKAYNPPCAFTPYATCPLPAPQNRLSVKIEAGELNYGHH